MLFFQIVAFYLGIGLVSAVFFAALGAQRANAERAVVTIGARVLLVPGAMILWPLVLLRWRQSGRRP